jgi:DNA polymerase-3 subunit epsilon
VAEARAIARETPPYNRRGKAGASWYVKASVRKPRVAPARSPSADGSTYLGPLPSLKHARTLIDTVRDATAVHRCASPASCRGCAFADLGTCAGLERSAHEDEVRSVVDAFTRDPGIVVRPLEEKMRRLAHQERFEEAAELRDRARSLARWIERSIEARALVGAGEVVLRVGGRAILLVEGQLASSCNAGDRSGSDLLASLRRSATWEPVGDWLTAGVQREVRAVVSWLNRHSADAEVLHVEGEWAVPARAKPTEAFTHAGREDAAPVGAASRKRTRVT